MSEFYGGGKSSQTCAVKAIMPEPSLLQTLREVSGNLAEVRSMLMLVQDRLVGSKPSEGNECPKAALSDLRTIGASLHIESTSLMHECKTILSSLGD